MERGILNREKKCVWSSVWWYQVQYTMDLHILSRNNTPRPRQNKNIPSLPWTVKPDLMSIEKNKPHCPNLACFSPLYFSSFILPLLSPFVFSFKNWKRPESSPNCLHGITISYRWARLLKHQSSITVYCLPTKEEKTSIFRFHLHQTSGSCRLS